MFHPKKPSTMNSLQDDSSLVLTTDPKPRLRWTTELHQRFVDAITQLGGPDKATPKSIMRVMGVKGLTLYHLKSHLQKFRLGKQPHKEFYDHSMKEGERAASSLELQRNNMTSSGMMGRSMNEMQMEVNRRLHEQLEVQRRLQLRIEAQGKYMQTILQKACQTLAAGENITYNKPIEPQMNFAPLQDLNTFGTVDHQLELHHQATERSSSTDTLFLTNNDNFLRPNPNSNSTLKNPLIRADDQQIQIDRRSDIVDSASDIYEKKPVLSGDNSVGDI